MNKDKIEDSQIILKHFVDETGKKISYYKPSQGREIPLKQGSVRGYIPSLKPNLKESVLNYESQLERDFLYLLDHDPNCIDLQTQPCHVHYTNKNGREVKATPDVWAIFRNGKQFIFEVKPEEKLKKLALEENWQLKTKAIIQYCKDLNLKWTYQIITERKIHCIRLDNIKDMLGAAKHCSVIKVNKNIGHFNEVVQSILLGSSWKFSDVVNQIKLLLGLRKEEIISILKNKIYFNQFHINWDIPFEQCEVSIIQNHPITEVYSLPNIYPKGKGMTSSYISKPIIRTEKDQMKFNERISILSPIIEKYGKNAKRADVAEYCINHDLTITWYKWYLIWKKEGKKGLYPKLNRKHKTHHLRNTQASNILSNFIIEWNKGEWQSYNEGYKDFYTECLKQGISRTEIPCVQTFRNWIKKIPSVEKRGKFKPSRQKYITKGLRSTYQEGRYPGAIIQMDHTLLDIWLVNSFTKQPLGRPWITAGIDVFSRNIWGFYLSFESPSQESVLNAIINGLILKKDLVEWKIFESNCLRDGFDPMKYHLPCAGYPALIQVDNGKDFQAKSVKSFFMQNNITLEFRPTYTPNYGGYIEAPWDTINDAIRGAKLPGRVFSMPKSRDVASNRKFKIPPRYDAKKNARLTLEEFREWLFRYFTVQYCAEIKASQNQTPNEVWLDGVCGNNFQPMGGAVRVAKIHEIEVLKFLSKRIIVAQINEKGLRYKNIYYTSEWLIEARKNGKIQGKQEFRVSHLDIRYIYVIDPETREIHTLQAYNYKGDDRILSFIRKSLGEILGYKGFPLNLKMLEHIKNEIGDSDYDNSESLLLMDSIRQKIQKKKKLAHEDQKFLETISKTNEGRETMAQAVKNIQKNNRKRDYEQQLIDNDILENDEFEEDNTQKKIDWSKIQTLPTDDFPKEV